jgi:DNA/RNA-binding domain of Phe-tRNA-synthetase-like protein
MSAAATPGGQRVRQGAVEAAVAAELPGLRLRWIEVPRGSGRSSRQLKRRLAALSDRFGGPQAIALRSKPIPWAYRVFYRQIGLDPDEQPTPVEAVALERMRRGGFVSRNLLDDALTMATIESGVALRAFDAERVEGGLGIRRSGGGDALEGRPGDLPTGTLVVADQRRPLALLFGATASGRGVSRRTERMIIVAVGVRGVPEISVEEALWIAGEAIAAG